MMAWRSIETRENAPWAILAYTIILRPVYVALLNDIQVCRLDCKLYYYYCIITG